MDQNTPPPGKSYSEVMNEWAAQQAFVKGNRSRLLHPPYESHPLAKLVGYLARLVAVLILPAGIYIYLVLKWAGSPEFNTMVTKGLGTTLQASSVRSTGAKWQLGGQLAMPVLDATGAPNAFYDKLHAETVSTRVPLPMFIRREWILPRVSIASLDLTLRSGGAGTVPIYEIKDEDLNMEPFLQDKEPPATPPAPSIPKKTAALSPPPEARKLTAGYGIDPNFASLLINAVQVGELNLNWGGGGASAGSLTGTQAEFTRSTDGWIFDATGGNFQQGWLQGWSMGKTSLKISGTKAVISETPLKHSEGGTAKFSGDVTLGDVPEVFASLHLDGVRLQDLVSPVYSGFFNAEVSGDLKLTGSTNRSTGIQTQGKLHIDTGRFNPLPIFNALQRITGETQFTSLPMKGANFTLRTGGLEASSGSFIEVPTFEVAATCCKVNGNLRYERSRPLGTQLDTKAAAEKITASGLIRIGIPPELSSKFKAEVARKYLVKADDGWSWLEIRFEGPPNGELTAGLASDMILMSDKPGP